MGDFLSFCTMITPFIVQIAFRLGVLGVVITGFVNLFNHRIGYGLLLIVLGPIAVRVYCEILIFFPHIRKDRWQQTVIIHNHSRI